MTITTQEITTRINQFDYYYNMSDSHQVYDRWEKEKIEIIEVLSTMTPDQLNEIKTQITVSDKCLNWYFAQFFVGATEEMHVSDEHPEKGEQRTDEAETPTAAKSESLRSVIFRNAWAMFRGGVFKSFRAALSAAWSRFKLVRSLRKGLAYFSFSKATGEIREAIGTLAGNNFDYQYKGAKRTNKPELVKYWDVQKRAFRSCRIDLLISKMSVSVGVSMSVSV